MIFLWKSPLVVMFLICWENWRSMLGGEKCDQFVGKGVLHLKKVDWHVYGNKLFWSFTEKKNSHFTYTPRTAHILNLWVLFSVHLNFSQSSRRSKMSLSNNKQEQNSSSVNLTEADWKAKLSPEEYRVLREKGTEQPYKGKYNEHNETGTYKCAGCGQALYEWVVWSNEDINYLSVLQVFIEIRFALWLAGI